MWTLENRPRYDRGKLRYPSGSTDEEWALFGWQQANGGCESGAQRGDVYPQHRLSVGPSATQHGQ